MPTQAIRLDNFKAQYNSILGNIKIVNLELGGLLFKKDGLKVDIKNLNSELRKKHTELSTLTTRSLGTLSLVDRKIRDLHIKEVSFEEEAEAMSMVIQTLDIKKSKLLGQSSETQRFIEQLATDKKIASESLDKIREIHSELQDSHYSLVKENNSLIRENKRFEKDYMSRSGEVDKEMLNKVNWLHSLEVQIDTEIVKVGAAKKSIEDREKDMTRRERDFDILVNRLRVVYNEVKPGISLKI